MTYRIDVHERETGAIVDAYDHVSEAELLETMSEANRLFDDKLYRIRLYEVKTKEVYWRTIPSQPSPAELRHEG